MPLDERIRERLPYLAGLTTADVTAQSAALTGGVRVFAKPVWRYRSPDVNVDVTRAPGPHDGRRCRLVAELLR